MQMRVHCFVLLPVLLILINHDLLNLIRWTKQLWLINLNPLKTEAVLSTLRQLVSLPNLIFDGTPIKFVTDH